MSSTLIAPSLSRMRLPPSPMRMTANSAGGQTMIPVLKQRLAMPSDVVELMKIDDLRGITVNGGWVTIGAMTPHALVHKSMTWPALSQRRIWLAIGDPRAQPWYNRWVCCEQ